MCGYVCVPETRQHVMHRKLIYVKSYVAAAKAAKDMCVCVCVWGVAYYNEALIGA